MERVSVRVVCSPRAPATQSTWSKLEDGGSLPILLSLAVPLWHSTLFLQDMNTMRSHLPILTSEFATKSFHGVTVVYWRRTVQAEAHEMGHCEMDCWMFSKDVLQSNIVITFGLIRVYSKVVKHIAAIQAQVLRSAAVYRVICWTAASIKRIELIMVGNHSTELRDLFSVIRFERASTNDCTPSKSVTRS